MYPAGWRSHEDAMRDPSDTRDIGPRIGSPFWIYLTVVTVAGLGALLLVVLLRGLSLAGLHAVTGHPLFWVLAALSVLGELKPIVTPGKSRPDAGVASVTFCFAALLYWGFPAAAGLRAITTLFVALSGRKAPHRCAFNLAQYTLSLVAAAAVLAAGRIHPLPLRPWVPTGGQLGPVGLAALAYFTVNFLLVGMAVTLHERTPFPVTLRRALPYQAFVSLTLLSAAPLVVVVMNRSVLLVLLFLLPLIAVYANAAISMQREHQALHDQLTGLPNRALLLNRAAEAVAGAARTGGKTGFLLLDLDRFKEVNDTLGHALGDGLLQAVAYRLARSVRPGDVVARIGGDEFAVLLPAVRAPAAAREVAARLRAALAEPVRLEGMSFDINASAGIALYPDDAELRRELLLQRPTWPCTWPRSGAPGWSATEARPAGTSRPGCRCSATCAGDRPRRVRAVLPAHRVPGGRSYRRDGGAAPLAAPPPWPDRAGRVHPAGRAVVHHARPHRARGPDRAPPGRAVAAARPPGAAVGERVRARPARRRAGGHGRG